MAGDGRLLDDSPSSHEFRTFLSEVEADHLERFVAECLEREAGSTRKGFPDSGFVLQDVVNEIGRRLDFNVTNGIYQGRKGVTGYDGIWQDSSGNELIVEVKTTDTYTIALDQIERYRRELIDTSRISESSSILFVVGRDDTGALEAQIRGSRHAWTMRMIGASSLVRLLKIKVHSESVAVVTRIKSLLRPIEYTRIDGIVDLMFDVRVDTDESEAVDNELEKSSTESLETATARAPTTATAFGIETLRQSAADSLSSSLGVRLTRRRRSLFETADGFRAVIAVSKRYDRGYQSYWYAFYDAQLAYLQDCHKGYLVLCAMDTGKMWALPVSVVEEFLAGMNCTHRPDGQTYWHVLTKVVGNDCLLVSGQTDVSLASYEAGTIEER